MGLEWPAMRFTSRLLGAFLPLAAGALSAYPAGAQIAGGNRESSKTLIANYRQLDPIPAGGLLKIKPVDGLLTAELIAKLPENESIRVSVEGSNAVWAIRNRNGAGLPMLTMTRYDFDAPADANWSISLSIRNNYFSIYAQTGDIANGARTRLTQSGKTLRLTISDGQRGIQNSILNAQAETLQQLQKEHPEPVRKYLAPVLRIIAGSSLLKPGPADVYRMFGSIPADPDAAKALDELMPLLDGATFTVREEAARRLAAMGTPGVLAVVRRSRDDLSVEARNRIDAFLAGQASLDLDTLDSARRDPYLLMDCLDDEDVSVRAAAKAALEDLAGKPIEFDVHLEGAARAEAIEKIRPISEKLARPTTRPALPPKAPPLE